MKTVYNKEMETLLILLEELKSKFDKVKKPKAYYRNSDLKELFGLSDNTILSYRQKNILPYTRIGDIYYYPIEEIDKILKSNCNFDLVRKMDLLFKPHKV
jgi:hypothetical protein